MLNSVRVRLTLWYAAVLACVLVTLAITTYFVLRQNSSHRTDTAIAEMAESFLTTVNAEAKDAAAPDGLKTAIDEAISEHKYRDTVFVVFDGESRVIASSDHQLLQGEPSAAVVKILQEAVGRDERRYHSFRTVRLQDQAQRRYVREFSIGAKKYTLLVLQSLHRQREFLESLSTTFAIVIPLAVFLASGAGYFLARRSLSSVVEMSAQAGRIGADNLHERLQVKNAKDELGQLAKSFNHLLDRLDQSFEQQRRFMADASHELRTPVAILCGEADVSLSQPSRSSEDYRASLDILRSEARRLKHIVEDLFTLARADAGQHPLTLTDFYLDELVAECSRSMRTLAAAKQITLICDASQEMPIRADETLLRRMIVNLLDNAIKYTPQQGRVSATCNALNSEYVITVSDTGQGIPHELQSRVFERFFRADKVRSRSESDGGAGLGLSISEWIVHAHGGRLELTRSANDGSTFTVYLPIAIASPLIPRLSSSR
ncbi:MAG TPA: ATP-binding protein [Candidatus Aquilonibacter sp.]|jgi:two-component system OmpR family sensor kinase|nr:ATP-binding protein [Candidatus Aquilonibacter sp.]